MFKKIPILLLIFCLIFEQSGFAQSAAIISQSPDLLTSSQNFRPAHLRSVILDTYTSTFKLLIDKGGISLKDDNLQEESDVLFKYFQTALRLPNSVFWVNLRPDSDKNIIDPHLERTDVGKIFLEADIQLKKDVARFTSPDTAEGREYWNKLYDKASGLFGQGDIEIPTATRPWIVPGEVIIKQTENGAYVYKAGLKVMLEQDYIKDAPGYDFSDPRVKELNEYSSSLVRRYIIPKLTREVNASGRYAALRQVYYSLVLAQWFKSRVNSPEGRSAARIISGQIDSKDLSGLTSRTAWSKTGYYKEYKRSFQTGEYDVQETARSDRGLVIRRYFSGGIEMGLSAAASSISSVTLLEGGNLPGSGLVVSDKAVVAGEGRAIAPEAPRDGGAAAIQDGAPFPFPNFSDNQRGWDSPEWMESYIAGSVIAAFAKAGAGVIKVKDIVPSVISRAVDYGLHMNQEAALARLEGLRLRGIISSGDNGSPIGMDGNVSVFAGARFISVWSDDFMSIRKDIEDSLAEGEDVLLQAIREYSEGVGKWDMYPVEAMYPVLRAVALMDADKQAELVDILSKHNKDLHTHLANAMILMLDYDKGKFNWFNRWAPNLHGRRIYMVAAEATLLAGGLGRVMQYHGTAASELGADIAYVEPYYHIRRDKSGKIIKTDYSQLPVYLTGLEEIKHEFSTIVGGKKVPFRVYTGINPNGIRSYLIKDDWDYYVNLLYEYGDNNRSSVEFDGKEYKLVMNQEFTEFFTKASAEVIRHLEIQTRAKKMKNKENYLAPVIDANDGQSLPLLAWIRMFYQDKNLIDPSGVTQENVEATHDIFSNAVLSGTTHTYRNRGIIADQWYGLQFLRNAGVRDEWLWLFMRKEDNNPVVWDLTSGGLRSADVAKGVSAIHAYEMAYRDPLVKLFGVTNGDNRFYSSEFFRSALKEAGGADYEHATEQEVARAKKIAKRALGLNDSQLVISYSGRLVPEKAGRERAFTDENIEAMVKEGIQVVIYGNVQQYEASLTIADQLNKLQVRLDRSGYPGKFIFRPRFDVDDQRRLLAASDLQIQDSDRFTGASEYTESNASANGALQMGAPFWEGIIQHQGGVIDRAAKTGNTVIPYSTKPIAYLRAIQWVNEQFKSGELPVYQAQSVRFSRILEARITGAAYLTLWDSAAGAKTADTVKPRIAGEINHSHGVSLSADTPEGEIRLDKAYGNTFCLKNQPVSARDNLRISLSIGLETFSSYPSGGEARGVIDPGYISAKIVNQYGNAVAMELKKVESDHAVLEARIPANFPMPLIAGIFVTSGLWNINIPVRIFANDPQSDMKAMDGGMSRSEASGNKVGGIDFRAVPVTSVAAVSPALSFSSGRPGIAGQIQPGRWAGIVQEAVSGKVPYEKIKEYIIDCHGACNAESDFIKVSDYLQDLLKKEEESDICSDPGMKEVLAYLG